MNREGSKAEMMRFPDRSTGVGGIISAYLGRKEELHDKVSISYLNPAASS